MPKGENPASWGNGKRSTEHHRWNDGRVISAHGYVKVRVGLEHPLADPNGYAYEHLVVWISAGKPRPDADEVLHHRNEQRTDNRLGNLELITRSDHNRHHIASRQRDSRGRLLPLAS